MAIFTTDFGTAEGILQNNYVGKMREVINNSCKLLLNMKKKSLTWNGGEAIVAVHTGQPDNVAFSAAGSVPAAATKSRVAQLRVPAAKLYGSIELEGEMLAASAGPNAKAFVSALTLETKGLTNSIQTRLNRYSYSGGRCVGFLNELKTAAGAADWQFSGDTDKVQAALTAKGAPIACTFYRLDTYASLNVDNVSAVTAGATGTITVDGGMDSAALPAGTCIGVKITDAHASLNYLNAESVGVYGNAIEPTHFSVSRIDGSGNETLQFVNRTANRVSPQARTTFALDHFQAMLDDIMVESNGAPDRIFVHTNFRSQYAKLFEAKMSVQLVQGKGATGYNGGSPVDGKGEQSYAYAGIEIEQDRHCAKGLALFLTDDSWIYAQRGEGDFDKTGGMFKQNWKTTGVGGTSELNDSFVAYWKQYFNVVCVEGFRNGVLCGLPII